MTGTNGDDVISGLGGDDLLVGGAGNDTLDGGAGTDEVRYSGALSDYEVTALGGGQAQVRALSGDEGTDVITNVERLVFSDGTLGIADGAFLPVAGDDSVSGTEDTGQVISAASLLANDTDLSGVGLTLISVSSGTGGTVVLDGNGDVAFTPDADYTGEASFSYTVRDSLGNESTATVTVDVGAVNDAPVVPGASFAGTEDTGQTISAADLLAGASDVDGDALTLASVGNATGGSVSLDGNGDVVFTPDADFAGEASFEYVISDGHGGETTARATVSVAGVNDAPEAADDLATVAEDGVLRLDAAALGANDRDADGDALSIQSVSNAVNGTVALVDGEAVFTPTGSFTGWGSFDYVITDGNGGTSSATVTVKIGEFNTAPVAADETVGGVEDVAQVIAAASLLANETDIDGDALTIVAVSNATGGSVSLDGNGDVLFTPDANFHGAASFDYTVSDGNGGSASATATINVASVNDAPTGSGETIDATEDTALTIAASVLLANEADADGDTLTIASVANASSGNVSLDGNGDVAFTPAADFSGNATFEYIVTDGNGGTTTQVATVSVASVNDAPVADAGTARVLADGSLSWRLSASDVDDASGTLTYSLETDAANGAVTVGADGTYVYVPASGYTGPDSFSFRVTDAGGLSSVATVTVEVTSASTTVSSSSDLWSGATGAFAFDGDDIEVVAGDRGMMMNGDPLSGDVHLEWSVAEQGNAWIGLFDVNTGVPPVLDYGFYGVTDAWWWRGNSGLMQGGSLVYRTDPQHSGLNGHTVALDRTDGVLTFQVDGVVVHDFGHVGTGDLGIAVGSTGYRVPGQLEDISWRSGGAATAIATTEGNDAVTGTNGDDVISGLGGDDLLVGGAGNDTLAGGDGADRFDFSVGGGRDVITDFEARTDRIELTGFANGSSGVAAASAEALTWLDIQSMMSQVGSDVVIGLGNGDMLTLANVDLSDLSPGDFGLTADDAGTTGNDTLVGTTGDDTIHGDDGDDTIDGGSGNDTLFGDAGNDIVSGGLGNDIVAGGYGADTLDGGAGDDYLDAGYFDDVVDTYIIGDGAGNDTITYPTAIQDVIDIIQLTGSGMPSTWTEIYNSATQSGSDLLIDLGTGDTLTLSSAYLTRLRAATFGLSADSLGTAGDDTLTGDMLEDTLTGLSGNDSLFGGGLEDVINGGAGNDIMGGGYNADTFLIADGDGNDTITDFTAGEDRILLDGVSSGSIGALSMPATWAALQAAASQVGSDVVIDLGDGDVLTLLNVDLTDLSSSDFGFPSGTFGTTQNDTLTGTSGVDTIDGLTGDDTIMGLGGNDTLLGGAGNDTLDGGSGTDVVDGGSGNDLLLDYDEYEGHYETFIGGAGDDTILISGGEDSVLGGSGNDSIIDVSSSGGSNDYIDGGDDDDFIMSGSNGDRVQGGAGNDTIDGGTSRDELFGGDGNDTIYGGMYGGAPGDTIDGGAGNDVLHSAWGLSADTLTGGAGDDTFVIHRTEAINTSGYDDTITDFTNGEDIIDLSDFSDSLDFASLQDVMSQSGSDVRIELDDDRTLLLQSVSLADLDAGDFNFTPGSSDLTGTAGYDMIAGTLNGDTLDGAAGNDTLYGSAGNDTLLGDAGTDTLDGGSGHDTLVGGDGNDSLVGGTGNDTIEGGAGDDWLFGSLSDFAARASLGDADRFIFSFGDGNDTIADFDVGEDIIELNGLSIDSLSESYNDRYFTAETSVHFDDGSVLKLLGVSGLVDPDDLLS